MNTLYISQLDQTKNINIACDKHLCQLHSIECKAPVSLGLRVGGQRGADHPTGYFQISAATPCYIVHRVMYLCMCLFVYLQVGQFSAVKSSCTQSTSYYSIYQPRVNSLVNSHYKKYCMQTKQLSNTPIFLNLGQSRSYLFNAVTLKEYYVVNSG